MLKTKFGNPLADFVCHGLKTATISGVTYQYSLLVDMKGQCLIQRLAADQSQFLFNQMPDPGTEDTSEIADAISAFWVDPTVGPFKYLFEL